MSLPKLPNLIDSSQLTEIKAKFAARDRVNSEYSDEIKKSRENPVVLFNDLSTPSSIGQATLMGLKYPIELDGNGGLMMSSGYDRIGQQVYEILDTRYGERVYRPFLGTPELLFETISESVLQQTLRKQILTSIPYLKEDNVKVTVSMKESGLCEVVVFYSTNGAAQGLVKYQFQI